MTKRKGPDGPVEDGRQQKEEEKKQKKKRIRKEPASGSDIAIPTTLSPLQTFGMMEAFNSSLANFSIILMGPTFASKTGNPTAEDVFALTLSKIKRMDER